MRKLKGKHAQNHDSFPHVLNSAFKRNNLMLKSAVYQHLGKKKRINTLAWENIRKQKPSERDSPYGCKQTICFCNAVSQYHISRHVAGSSGGCVRASMIFD